MAVTLVALVALAGAARAQSAPSGSAMDFAPPSATARDMDRRTVTKRYGGDILMADVGAFGLALATQRSEVSLVGYALGGPLVHLVHGNRGRALGSFTLRVVLPVAGLAIGEGMSDCDSDDELFCGFGEMVIGGTIGVAAAIAIDAGVLAKETKVVETPRRGLVQVGDVAVTPTLARQVNGGWTMGLTGTF